jgi:hypothetical protein
MVGNVDNANLETSRLFSSRENCPVRGLIYVPLVVRMVVDIHKWKGWVTIALAMYQGYADGA